MAKKTNISYKSSGNNNDPQQQNGGVPFQPTTSNYFQQYQNGMDTAKTMAPPAAATPEVLNDTEVDSKQLVNPYIQQARDSLLPKANIGQQSGVNFTPKYQPKVYNQDALDQYDQGLQAARGWDASSSLSPGFKERIYRLINGDRPDAQLSAYVPNAAMQYQTKDFGDGSVLQNPNTNPELAMQWNVARLKQIHPDWDDDMINQYMNQQFNWQSAQALTNEGAWQPVYQ